MLPEKVAQVRDALIAESTTENIDKYGEVCADALESVIEMYRPPKHEYMQPDYDGPGGLAVGVEDVDAFTVTWEAYDEIHMSGSGQYDTADEMLDSLPEGITSATISVPESRSHIADFANVIIRDLAA